MLHVIRCRENYHEEVPGVILQQVEASFPPVFNSLLAVRKVAVQVELLAHRKRPVELIVPEPLGDLVKDRLGMENMATCLRRVETGNHNSPYFLGGICERHVQHDGVTPSPAKVTPDRRFLSIGRGVKQDAVSLVAGEVEDAVLSSVAPGGKAGPGHGRDGVDGRLQWPPGTLFRKPSQVRQLPLGDGRPDDVKRRPVYPKNEDSSLFHVKGPVI